MPPLIDPRQGGAQRLGGRSGSRGGGGVSPNRFPGSRSAGGPVFPVGTNVRVVPVAPRMPPPMPVPPPAGPYEQENALGPEAMAQTINSSFPVTNAASVVILQRNTARKALIISNPSTTLTIFLDFADGPATALSMPLFPLGQIQFFSGERQQIIKERVFALASGAGPVLVQVTEFA